MRLDAPSLPVSVVVDASVAAKWLFTEAFSPEALGLLNGDASLYAPDLLLPEVGNILWKRVRSGEISREKAEELLGWLLNLPLLLQPAPPLIAIALQIAGDYGCTVYDSLYVALSVQVGCPLVTADEKLVQALSLTPLASSLLPVQCLPSTNPRYIC